MVRNRVKGILYYIVCYNDLFFIANAIFNFYVLYVIKTDYMDTRDEVRRIKQHPRIHYAGVDLLDYNVYTIIIM